MLIAESPPRSENGRFFHNPDQEKYDFLFKSIMGVIFPDFTANYRKGQKHKYLQRFKEQGFYLIDAVDTPINDRKQRERDKIIRKNLKNKIKEMEELISKDIPIILIKKNIFEIFCNELKKGGFNVVHTEYVPLPSSGHQRKFKEYLTDNMETADNRWICGSLTIRPNLP